MKLPRFNSFHNKPEELTDDTDFIQHVRLPLPPNVYHAYQKQMANLNPEDENLDKRDIRKNVLINSYHSMFMLYTLMGALNVESEEFIEYLKNIEKGESKGSNELMPANY